MFYRQAELLATEDITTAGTKTVDINVKDVISRLMVVLELINNGTNPTDHPLAAIKNIEVIDGSEVIASMTGYEAQAMAYYNNGVMPHNELNYEDNGYARCFIPLDFGRFLYDEDLGLDPARFRNLQLRIEHDYSLGGSSPDGAYLRVLGDLFDEKVVSPAGYLLNKEVMSFLPVAGSGKYVELPLDNAIRKILAINTNDDEQPDVQFETVKIDEEDGKRVVIDCLTADLIRIASTKFGRFGELMSAYITAETEELWTSAAFDNQISVIADGATVLPVYSWSGGRARTITAAVAGFIACVVSGRCPHGAVPVFFGKQDNLDDWWDVSRLGKARVTLTPRATPAINSDKNTNIVVQSLHRY